MLTNFQKWLFDMLKFVKMFHKVKKYSSTAALKNRFPFLSIFSQSACSCIENVRVKEFPRIRKFSEVMEISIKYK